MSALLLAGCGASGTQASSAAGSGSAAQSDAGTPEAGETVRPLPTTLSVDSLEDCTFAASFAASDVALDGDGMLCVTMTVYDYERFDLVDISELAEGDTLVIDGKDVPVESVERSGSYVTVNGGLEEGGYDLYTEEDGVYYEVIMDAGANYYAIGEVTLPVDQEFVFTDNADLEKPGQISYAGDFLMAMEDSDDVFQANATTVRTADGKIVELTRNYMP